MRQLFDAAGRRARHFIKTSGPAADPNGPGRRRRRPCVESLELRQLLSTITEYSVPLVGGKNGQPAQITVGPNDTLYFVEPGTNSIGSVSVTNPNPVTVTTLPTGSIPDSITLGPDGNLWFTEFATGQIGSVKLTGTTPPTPTGITANSGPAGITSADGYLWFTQSLSDQIGRLNPMTGQITEYTAPTAMSSLDSRIVLGADGDLWFTEFGAIAAFNPSNPNIGTTLNVTKTVALPGGSHEAPEGITAGPGGTIWYTEGVFNSGFTGFVSYGVGAINANMGTLIRETPVVAASEPEGITAGPDGNIWFTVTGTATVAGTIDSINPSTYAITTLAIPTNVVATPAPIGIVAAPDGNLWFSDSSGAIGVVATSSPTPTPTSPTPTPTSPTPTPTSPTPTPTPPPAPTIIGEQAVFIQKTKKVGKKIVKVGKPVFSGFMITFSTAMNQGTLGNAANYVMDTTVPVKKTKKNPATTKVTPVRFSVTAVTSNSVTLKPAGTPFATKAGMIVVNASTGVESAAGAFMAPPSVTLPIAKGGKSIS
jgi:streptogramin lyase